MKVLKHEIKDFRNIESLCFEPDEGINVIYGENGQGKTKRPFRFALYRFYYMGYSNLSATVTQCFFEKIVSVQL